ncbi:MAG: diacylglycerol kinase [Beijerinckiaceae bacterium]
MKRIVAAFFNSMRGLSQAGRHETAVRQELILLVVALVIAPLIARSIAQFIAMMTAVLMLLSVEILNTAIEELCDHITPEHNDRIGYIKDLGSAAVFFMLLICALVWGGVIVQNFWLA